MASLDYARIWRRARRGDFDALTDAEFFGVLAIALAVVVAVLLFAFRHVEPPPRTVRMSTGAQGGAYHAYGQRYRTLLARRGITLELVPSKGALENLARLRDDASGVSIALVQTGVDAPRAGRPADTAEPEPDDEDEDRNIESLASVAFEPVWVFHRLGKRLAGLGELAGKRVAIGVPGSGARPVAEALLQANGLTADKVQRIDDAPADAIAALKAGTLDAAFVVAAPNAPIVQQALADGLDLVDFTQADAYVRRFPWLSKLTLPRGTLDLAANRPNRDLTLLAATANLVTRGDLHPAIVYLLMDVAMEAHAGGSMLHAPGDFPTAHWLAFPQSAESVRYFKSGRPLMQRYLPFWVANFLERLSVSVLPVLLVLLPVLKMLPAFFGWRERTQFARLYERVRQFEAGLAAGGAAAETAAIEARLAEFDRALDGFGLKSSRLAEFYTMRTHLAGLRQRYVAGR